MEYSKKAYRKGWGRPFALISKVTICLLIISCLVTFGLTKEQHTYLPKLLGDGIALVCCLTIFGAPLALALYIGFARQCKQHVISISEGRLLVSLSVQSGWSFSPAGFVFEDKDYIVYRVRNYTESKRNFFVYGEIGYIHSYQGVNKPEVMVEKVKIPKVFTGEDMLREFLNAVREEV